MKARFHAIEEADISARVDFLSASWVEAFGDLQRQLSAATDDVARTAARLTRLSSCYLDCKCSITNFSEFLEVPAFAVQRTHINNACIRILINLRYRQAQLYPSLCPASGCNEKLDVFGDHALCCKKGGEPTIRHNRLAQRVALECGKAVAGVSLEARLLLQKSDERPADILLTAWRGGALAIDVTVPHVITKRTPDSAVGLHAMEAAMHRKRTKYQARCQEVGINFMALAFDTLGAVHPEAKDFLSVMFKDAMSRQLCPDHRYIEQAWHRVVVPLQVDVARQILARSVPPSLETLSSTVFLGPSVPCPTIALNLKALPAPAPLASFWISRSGLAPSPSSRFFSPPFSVRRC